MRKRRILLIEPNYKNKYPPMGLMKLSTYYRRRGDDVCFFKGILKDLVISLFFEQYISKISHPHIYKYRGDIEKYIKSGNIGLIESILFLDEKERELLRSYRTKYQQGEYPKFDVVCITTLFTFYYKQIIETINFSKNLCRSGKDIKVGGIAAGILSKYIERDTGIKPHKGLLNKKGILDADDETIIDELPLDYSILDEIEYKYPSENAYFSYMTRGCPNKCAFCVVPELEPKYCNYIGLKKQIAEIDGRCGAKKDLLLMDNNVLASKSFNKIIDEIKKCGFAKDAAFSAPNFYDIAVKNIKDNWNGRAYKKQIIDIYDKICGNLSEAEQAEFYIQRDKLGLLYQNTVEKKAVIEFDPIAKPLYEKHLYKHSKKSRYVDFNQGIDVRLINEANMKKLSEINIRPLRIAFDNYYSMKELYENAVRLAAANGIKNLSNYLLYNFTDKPDELWNRMNLNVNLCEELDISIYSFPMKYHPIKEEEWFDNRGFIGEHWNRKFIRAIQAVLNATKGKIGRGKPFFKEAFGGNLDEFEKILWMPEALIIHRFKYKDNLTKEWRHKFMQLSPDKSEKLKKIVAKNKFSESIIASADKEIQPILQFYMVKRDKA